MGTSIGSATESGANATAAAPPTGNDDDTVARAGENLVDIARDRGIPVDKLIDANPQISNPLQLAPGTTVHLPPRDDATRDAQPASAATTGAMGREAAVNALSDRAYQAGYDAPRSSFSGDIFRNTPTRWVDGTFDHTAGGRGPTQGRYNGGGEPMIYASPSAAESIGEMKAYGGMANRSLVRSTFDASVGTDGRGGVADVERGLSAKGLPESTVTTPKGMGRPPLAYRLTGENPYTLPQQVGKGAADAGASAIRAPSATGGSQIDIIPRNTDPASISPRTIVDYDGTGAAGAARGAGSVTPMPPDPSTPKSGPLEGPARAGSARYGAIGGAGLAIATDLARAATGGQVSAGQIVGDAGTAGGVGAASAKAADALATRIGAVKAGGVVGAVLEGGVSTIDNAEAYRAGKESAAQATANVAVDTTVGLSAGLAGAGAGAVVGSVVPVAGTAVGAVVGFAAGVGTAYAVHWAAQASGLASDAKAWLGRELSGHEATLEKGWNTISSGVDAAKRAAGEAKSAVASGLGAAWSFVTGK